MCLCVCVCACIHAHVCAYYIYFKQNLALNLLMSKMSALRVNAMKAQSALNLKVLVSPAGAVLVKYIFHPLSAKCFHFWKSPVPVSNVCF